MVDHIHKEVKVHPADGFLNDALSVTGSETGHPAVEQIGIALIAGKDQAVLMLAFPFTAPLYEIMIHLFAESLAACQRDDPQRTCRDRFQVSFFLPPWESSLSVRKSFSAHPDVRACELAEVKAAGDPGEDPVLIPFLQLGRERLVEMIMLFCPADAVVQHGEKMGERKGRALLRSQIIDDQQVTVVKVII